MGSLCTTAANCSSDSWRSPSRDGINPNIFVISWEKKTHCTLEKLKLRKTKVNFLTWRLCCSTVVETVEVPPSQIIPINDQKTQRVKGLHGQRGCNDVAHDGRTISNNMNEHTQAQNYLLSLAVSSNNWNWNNRHKPTNGTTITNFETGFWKISSDAPSSTSVILSY